MARPPPRGRRRRGPRRRAVRRRSRPRPVRRRAPRRARRARRSLFALGARFSTAARGRWVAAVATIAVCAGVVTLMLALASLLERLREDPGTVGKRYQLAVSLDPFLVPRAKELPGVGAVGQRFSIDAADSFRLGEPIRLVAYYGDHTQFEAPPLAEGRRIRGAERGRGRAWAWPTRSGCGPARSSPRRCPDGGEVRFRVAGIVRALENDGRIAWVQPERLLAARPDLNPQVVVRLKSGADPATVTRELVELGARLQPVGAAQTDNAAFLAVLAAVLRGVGLAVGLGLPLRARPGPDRDRARTPRGGRAAARVRRRRHDRRASSWRARRSPSRSPRRSSA